MQLLVRRLLFGGIAGKALGVVREVIAAWCFGTGIVANAYRMAQAALLLPLHGFVSDVTSGAFTPLYARLRASQPAEAARLFAALHACLLLIAVAAAAGLIVFAHDYIRLLAPGFSLESQALTTQLVRILSLALPPYVLISIYCAAEMVHGEGRITAARASFQSVGLMVGTVAAWFFSAPWMIALGFVAAYFALGLWGWRHCHSIGLRFVIRRPDWPAAWRCLGPVWSVFRVLMWVPVGLQISQVVERRVASGIHPGAVAGLDYARFATETLLILVAMPFGMAGQAAMPNMDEAQFRSNVSRALIAISMVGIPLSVFFSLHAEQVVALIFRRGAFDAESVSVTADIMAGQSLGLVFALIAFAGQKFLNARGRNAVVLRSTLAGVAVSVLGNLLLAKWLGPAVLGIASALTSLTVSVSVLVALRQVRTVLWELRWSWAVALLHLALISGSRQLWGDHWLLELLTGITVWSIFIGAHRPSRRLWAHFVSSAARRPR